MKKCHPCLTACFLGILLAIIAVSDAAEPALEKLVGTWVRPDGGYQLVIESVAADGEVKASYLNPSPIHVAEAKAVVKEGVTTLFVKLQDEGYPGSTYTLSLNAEGTRLSGDYFQASQKQTYSIHFDKEGSP